ncbi:ATP synthase regulation protein NCA2-domain-containing protein [Gymnopilus junonius]|uniref:ATP synthase regulation protein NCA2-domain-containing protein n=1 Tax=Gymnopilus junonius TaxID=109634 RepID=A0A9P5TNG0_GYMJU|nr:ATP synthase regulation protein NCA2-domain-containing protein [Gymnopilus junonius]
MPSEFVGHFTRSLELSASRPTSPGPGPREEKTGTETHATSQTRDTAQRKWGLHALFVSLTKSTLTADDVHQALQTLQDIDISQFAEEGADAKQDPEEAALEAAIVGKLTVVLYRDAMEACLSQATAVEAEAEWWAEIEVSQWQTALYLLETLPLRVFNVASMVIGEARAQRVPLSISTFSPASLRNLLRSSSHFTLQPGRLVTACFPHLQHHQSLNLAVLLASPNLASTTTTSSITSSSTPTSTASHLLTIQECAYKRKALERMRDQRAEMLGELAQLRTPLEGLYTSFLCTLVRLVDAAASSASTTTSSKPRPTSPIQPLQKLSQTLPTLTHTHIHTLYTLHLLRPSLLTRLWPKLLIFPPLALYIYSSRTSWIPALVDMIGDAGETVRGFVRGWLVEPLVGVLHTVRAGGKGDILVSQEGVKSDLESLNRMTLDLARDAMHLSDAQLAALSARVRMGDLTSVMEAYEEDIRTPFRSALRGTLLRNVFIQVQKAKVDIDQALAGIDRLLKSQELTFAFVGVAPALAVVWAFTTSVWGLWSGVQVPSATTTSTLPSTTPPSTTSTSTSTPSPIPALPTGLLILSLTRLRSFAIAHLPEGVREPFLEDLGDLEDTRLDRDAKMLVVQRMWRSWGGGGGGVLRI